MQANVEFGSQRLLQSLDFPRGRGFGATNKSEYQQGQAESGDRCPEHVSYVVEQVYPGGGGSQVGGGRHGREVGTEIGARNNRPGCDGRRQLETAGNAHQTDPQGPGDRPGAADADRYNGADQGTGRVEDRGVQHLYAVVNHGGHRTRQNPGTDQHASHLTLATDVLAVENPVEDAMTGINRVQVNEKVGLTFASALRAILRQDPDIVLIGEIRDKETARIATEAALTGHLVLSTIHTNSAPATITRLIDMGVEPFLVSSALTCVIAQRLVRRLDPKTKRAIQPTADMVSRLGITPDKAKGVTIIRS